MAGVIKGVLRNGHIITAADVAQGFADVDLFFPQNCTLRAVSAFVTNAAANATATLYACYLTGTLGFGSIETPSFLLMSQESLTDRAAIFWDGEFNLEGAWGVRIQFRDITAGDYLEVSALAEV